jgi:hypothetical protein
MADKGVQIVLVIEKLEGKLDLIHHDYSISEYSLTIRYRFNVAKKKYKGTGAGQSQKSRMSL